jgi:sugar/nucleoside kinase (ribokinase family)
VTAADPGASGDADYDVVAIGNALVDVISHEPFETVRDLGLEAGSMTLVDAETVERLYGRMGPATETSGGSAGNMVAGVADFGGRAAFIGRVADDTFGRLYMHDLRSIGVHFAAVPAIESREPTGRCLILVTPDAQRTMCTFLGAGTELDPSFVDEEVIAASTVLYLEGYLWDQPPAMKAFRAGAACAHRAGRKVALTLSDRFCVERHRAAFLELIEDEVDILFANESEILALYEVDKFDDALQRVRVQCETAALTRSAKGSVIVAGEEVHVIDAAPVAHVIDTTGAGDLYAAGFLYGYTHGHDLATCGALGSIAAAEVISHIGARPVAKLADLAGRVLARGR